MVNEKDEAVFGDGLAELLETIDKYHSILEAARAFGACLIGMHCTGSLWQRNGLGNCWLREFAAEPRAADLLRLLILGESWLRGIGKLRLGLTGF